jgi:hypothetical protein
MPLFGFTNVAGSVITQTSIAVASGGASDPDAQAFIDAASITDSTQISAVNQLVLDLKGYGVWDKCKAIYPILGGSASSHAVNLKTPGTYNLTFSTGWTHASTGMTSNGTGFSNTNFNTSTQSTLNSTHLSYYSRTADAISSSFEIGNVITSNSFGLSCGYGNVAYSDQYNYNTARVSQANTDARGFYIGTRTTSAIHKLFKNGNQFGTTNTGASGTFNNLVIYIGAYNNNGTASTNSVKQCAFASIGDGLTDTEAADFYTAVQAYQTTLSRNV